MNDTLRSHGSEVRSQVAAYFAEMRRAFDRAQPTEYATVQRSLAGRTLRFNVAGTFLFSTLQTALAHLPIVVGASDQVDLTVYAWDEAVTGVSLPTAPWQWPPAGSPSVMSLPPGAEDFEPHLEAPVGAFSLHQLSRNEVILHVRDARRLPTYWHGSPLFRTIHSWAQSGGLAMLHAGCVGTDGGAVLLAGKGGSGKSTTSLLCLEAGLRYVSDDYCLMEPGPTPRAHCLYNSGKLHRDHLARFPALAEKATDPVPDQFEKKVIFVQQHYPDRLASSLPLRAILLPRVAGGDRHQLRSISPMAALRGLAPSTLFQLVGRGQEHLQVMARLTRQIPCFELALCPDFDALPEFIRSALDSL